MRKRIFLTLVVLSGYCHGEFRGFYAGINGGGQITTAKGHAKSSYGFIDLFPNTTAHAIRESLAAYEQTWAGSVYLGYGQTCYCVFGSIEGFIKFPHYHIRQERAIDYKLKYDNGADFAHIREDLKQRLTATTRTVEAGIDFKPGYLLTPCTLFYGRVGAAFNRFTLKSDSLARYEDNSNGFATPSSATAKDRLCLSRSKRVTGLRLGVGFEHQICENFGITLDYIYTYYDHMSLQGQKETNERDRILNNGLSACSKVCFRNNAVLLGISYRFCLSSLWGYNNNFS